jgi:uncharacterized protein with NRDE domain
MCLILFAVDAHPAYRLVVAANRDEWFNRPSAPAAFWDDAPEVLAGRDLEANGTWMGVTRAGRFAALTNFRDPAANRPGAPSRGALVRDFLAGARAAPDYLRAVAGAAERYNPFSLLVGDARGLFYFSNRAGTFVPVAPGVHGLSNHLLDVPWPKVRLGKARLAERLRGEIDADALLAALDDPVPAPDDALPRTGVPLEWERDLSPLRIRTRDYGTRASTVLLVSRDGGVTFVERSFDAAGAATGTVRYEFQVEV